MNSPMNFPLLPLDSSRRSFLRSVSQGLGAIALAAGVGRTGRAGGSPLAPKPPHHEPKAKRVMMLCMEGGPSHVDTFDYKPELQRRAGRPIGRGRVPRAQLLPSPWSFQQGGESGLWISDLYPEVRRQADKLCVIRGMQTDIPAHPPAFIQMHTGISNAPRPSMGAWILYGLGSENENLPGFVTISPPQNFGGPINYGSAFLPAVFQGTRIGRLRQPIATAGVNNLSNMRRTSGEQSEQLEYLRHLNRLTHARQESNLFSEGLMESHELAHRMQGELPQVLDLDRESAETAALYGLDRQESEDFGRQCLMARRLLEAGVRFVEVCHGGWDQHRNLEELHGRHGRATDRPIAGLLEDLERRGLLDETLVIWGGEFGRTPYAQFSDGRDHNHRGFTTWMAGGGVKGGFSYGATDEFGLEAIENPLHIHDWHATILHLLGLNHERLTYRYAGRDMRLTDVKGRVAKDLIA
jgi:hypothetical protein